MVFIGIGSNLGNRIQNIENAKYNLKINGINILKFSKYYETLSWPDPTKPKFLNIVIQSNTRIPVDKLIKLFKLIEKKLVLFPYLPRVSTAVSPATSNLIEPRCDEGYRTVSMLFMLSYRA